MDAVALTAELAASIGAQPARWILEALTGSVPASWVVDDAIVSKARAMAHDVADGTPLQYVLGTWAFRSLELEVDSRALIPRPETEQVVEAALVALAGPPTSLVAVDLGTGTGAIACALAAELGPKVSSLRVLATDRMPEALELARSNADRLGLDVEFRHGRWWEALEADLHGQVGLCISNPPYVAEAEYLQLDPELFHEPRTALVAPDGADGTPGMADLEEICDGAARFLRPDGLLVLECAPHQVAALKQRTRALGDATVIVDLAGRERGVVVRRW